MSWENEIKSKIGDQHHELVKFAKDGRMTTDDFKQFAKGLTKPCSGSTTGELENRGSLGTTWWKCGKDWYVQEACDLTDEEARKKIYDVSKKVDNMNALFSEKRETPSDSRKDEQHWEGRDWSSHCHHQPF